MTYSPVFSDKNYNNCLSNFDYDFPVTKAKKSLDLKIDNIKEYEYKYVNENAIINNNIKRNSLSKQYYGKRVLVVDDSYLTRKMFCRFIIDRCESVDEADDGDVAVELVKNSIGNNKMYDVILMDFQMPNKIGPIAAKEMRELGYTGLIIGITGNVLEDDTSQYITSGADKVLFKPIDMQQLDYTIKGITN